MVARVRTRLGRERLSSFSDRTAQPYVRRIGIHARMPCHQVTKGPYRFWWFQKSKGQTVRFESRNATWDGREQMRARHAADGSSEIGNPDRTSPLRADSRQSLIEESLQLTPDSNADVFRRKILLERERPRILALLGRDAREAVVENHFSRKARRKIAVVGVEQ